MSTEVHDQSCHHPPYFLAWRSNTNLYCLVSSALPVS